MTPSGLLPALGAIAFPTLERIPLFGDAAISPHGIGIALGFLLGAAMMIRRAEKRGLGHTYVPDIRERLQDILLRAAVGAIIGSRLFFVLNNLDQYADDPLAALRVWEGGLTFLGGVAGAVLLVLPVLLRGDDFRVTQVLDSAAPGLAAGLVVGRLGDLVIGDHIGEPTDFALAWRCTGDYWNRATNSFGYVPPEPYPSSFSPTAGCFDVPVHQTALYDFGAALIVLLLLLWFERRPRFDGFFTAAWVYAYGALRFASDFAREDRRVFGLTGSQYAVLATMTLVTVWLVRRRPWRRRPWSWDREFAHPWLRPPGRDDGRTHADAADGAHDGPAAGDRADVAGPDGAGDSEVVGPDGADDSEVVEVDGAGRRRTPS